MPNIKPITSIEQNSVKDVAFASTIFSCYRYDMKIANLKRLKMIQSFLG